MIMFNLTYKVFLLPRSHSLQKVPVIQLGLGLTGLSFINNLVILVKTAEGGCSEAVVSAESSSLPRLRGGGDILMSSSSSYPLPPVTSFLLSFPSNRLIVRLHCLV